MDSYFLLKVEVMVLHFQQEELLDRYLLKIVLQMETQNGVIYRQPAQAQVVQLLLGHRLSLVTKHLIIMFILVLTVVMDMQIAVEYMEQFGMTMLNSAISLSILNQVTVQHLLIMEKSIKRLKNFNLVMVSFLIHLASLLVKLMNVKLHQQQQDVYQHIVKENVVITMLEILFALE